MTRVGVFHLIQTNKMRKSLVNISDQNSLYVWYGLNFFGHLIIF